MKINFKNVFMLVIFLLLCWRAIAALDPDFGWHFRLGETIIKSGIPHQDPFTFTMPGYPFVDYEWGSNILTYLGEQYLGRFFTAIIYALILIFSFRLAVPHKYKKYWWWTVWLGISVSLSRFAIRPQVISWLLTAAVIRLLSDTDRHPRVRWLFIPLMLVWANLHGSYFLGLGLWFVWWSVRTLRERKFYPRETVIGLLGSLATLVNPYGYRNWQEVLMQMSQTRLFSATLEEWQPFWNKLDLGMVAVWVWLGFLGWRFRTKLTWEEIVVSLIALIAGLTSLRHGVLTMVVITPLALKLWYLLEHEVRSIPLGPKRWPNFVTGAILLSAFILSLESFLIMRYQRAASNSFYPVDAVRYLKNHPLSGRLMSNYGWGGYLIWKLPQYKVFIDGRMSGWSWQAPPGQSSHAYREYLDMVFHPDIHAQKTLDAYQVDTILWRKDQPPSGSFVARKLDSLDNSGPPAGEIFENWLRAKGWNVIYEDPVSVIFSRPS